MLNNYKRYIFFSDLHGNYHALKNFYEYLRNLKEKTKVYFLGDLVGYYEFDLRIIEIFYKMISEFDLVLILGNHDAKLLNTYFYTSFNADCPIPLYGDILINGSMRKQIKDLLGLSKITEQTKIFNRNTIISHGGITDPLNDYYYPDLKFLDYNQKKFEKNTDYIFGHTHHYFLHKDNNHRRFINVGSLGMPRNQEVYGSFLEIKPDTIEIKKIKYDLDSQFEDNKKLPNSIKNRVYFGENSKYADENLEAFNSLELDIFNKWKLNNKIFKRLVVINKETKILKLMDGYLRIEKNVEKKYDNIDSLVGGLNDEI